MAFHFRSHLGNLLAVSSPTTNDSIVPVPNQLALCLSGGGFRAALFHVGALRRLNELGILSKSRTSPRCPAAASWLPTWL